jgi:diacylglycerol O-acyltransferase
VERMHGIDAFLVYSETATSPFATLKVTVYEPVDPNDLPDADELRRFVKTEIERLGGGHMGMRIVRVPFDLHHPVWLSDPAYSPDDHIHHTTLPPPGDKAQLCEFLSDLMGQPLNPDRPLWETWLVEGLEGGRIAVAAKVHHALADGKTVATLLARSDSGADEREASNVSVVGEPIPGKARLLFDALVDLFKTYTDEIPHFYRELREIREEAVEREAGGSPEGETEDDEPPAAVPFTVFNERAGGRHRVYRWETFSLDAFKRLSRIFGCTLNTLILGVCSEALKRYLDDASTLPAESLVTAMPVGDRIRRVRRTRLHRSPPHNSVAVAVLSLHTDIEDFGERLQSIQRSSKAAIDRVQRSYGRRFDNWLELLPGTVIRWGSALMGWQQVKRSNPYANVVISNVLGPGKTLYALDGRLRLVELLSTGNLHDLGNVNITVWSYVDNLSFSFYMRKDALPEPEKIPAYVRQVVEELEKRDVAGETAVPA